MGEVRHLEDAGFERLAVGVGLVEVQVAGQNAVLIGQANLDEACNEAPTVYSRDEREDCGNTVRCLQAGPLLIPGHEVRQSVFCLHI